MTHIQVIRYLNTSHLLLVVRIQVTVKLHTPATLVRFLLQLHFFYPQRELPFYESHQSYNILEYNSFSIKDSVVQWLGSKFHTPETPVRFRAQLIFLSQKESCSFKNPIKVIPYLSTNTLSPRPRWCSGQDLGFIRGESPVRFRVQLHFYDQKSFFFNYFNLYFLGFIVRRCYHFWYQNDDNEVQYQMICFIFVIVYI